MSTATAQLFSSMLALGTIFVGLVVLLSLCVGQRASWAITVVTTARESALIMIAVITSGAMIGSLYFSEVVNYMPCKLCWYQRIAMFSMAILSVTAVIRKERVLAPYLIVLSAVGLVVSTYHFLLEWFPQLESDVCSLDVPCTAVWFREFGFVTLSFMAGSAFIAVIAFSLTLMRDTSTQSEI